VLVLGEAVTVLVGTVVVAVSLGGTEVVSGGAVSVTVSGGAPPGPWWRDGSPADVVTAVVVTEGVGDVVGALGAFEPAVSWITPNTAAPSTNTPNAPAATSAAGRRYHGVGGSGSRWGSGSGSGS
jgi:hypothetical protein